MKPQETQQRAPRPYLKTGLFRVKRALKERGIRALDGRSTAARAIKLWRADVERDLGGRGALSRQQETILDAAAAAVFLLNQIDAWIGARPELVVNTRRRSVAPVVRERLAVAEHLARLLAQLGLERRVKPVPSLHELLAGARAAQAPASATQQQADGSQAAGAAPVAAAGQGSDEERKL